jgi:anti-anti-sigma factor
LIVVHCTVKWRRGEKKKRMGKVRGVGLFGDWRSFINCAAGQAHGKGSAMRLELVSTDGKLAKLRLGGRVTQEELAAGADPISETLGADAYSRKALVDLTGADFIDSSGVGWLLNCHKKFRQADGRFILHSIPPLVRRTLQVLRMELVLQLAKDEAEAETLAQA